jgi:hypothetical protein
MRSSKLMRQLGPALLCTGLVFGLLVTGPELAAQRDDHRLLLRLRLRHDSAGDRRGLRGRHDRSSGRDVSREFDD